MSAYDSFFEAATLKTLEALARAAANVTNINAINQDGDTAMIIVSKRPDGCLLAEYLLAHGADPNLRPRTSVYAPIHWAAKLGRLDTLNLLIESGANIEAISPSEHLTPLAVACIMGQVDCVKALLTAGANPNVRDRDEESLIESTVSQAYFSDTIEKHKECAILLTLHGADLDPLKSSFTSWHPMLDGTRLAHKLKNTAKDLKSDSEGLGL